MKTLSHVCVYKYISLPFIQCLDDNGSIFYSNVYLGVWPLRFTDKLAMRHNYS